jgi:hypothetical protein
MRSVQAAMSFTNFVLNEEEFALVTTDDFDSDIQRLAVLEA